MDLTLDETETHCHDKVNRNLIRRRRSSLKRKNKSPRLNRSNSKQG